MTCAAPCQLYCCLPFVHVYSQCLFECRLQVLNVGECNIRNLPSGLALLQRLTQLSSGRIHNDLDPEFVSVATRCCCLLFEVQGSCFCRFVSAEPLPCAQSGHMPRPQHCDHLAIDWTESLLQAMTRCTSISASRQKTRSHARSGNSLQHRVPLLAAALSGKPPLCLTLRGCAPMSDWPLLCREGSGLSDIRKAVTSLTVQCSTDFSDYCWSFTYKDRIWTTILWKHVEVWWVMHCAACNVTSSWLLT